MTATPLTDFILETQLSDVPLSAQRRLSFLLTDFAAASVAGRRTAASVAAAEFAGALGGDAHATALFDGRRLGVAGAAFANAVLANALDFDDGHARAKGHPGAVVIPAALAAAEKANASREEFFLAALVGYEVAIRAGIALHERDSTFRASGTWGSIGAAAAVARLLGLDRAETLTAIGLAEYHAPMAPIMRSCAEPAMTKDACAWGSYAGVASALLASCGFTSTRSEFADDVDDSWGSQWRVEEVYVKAFPCCRWAQGAIAATLDAAPLRADDISAITVRTFNAADGLAKVIPLTTEQAQFNLAWPVATAAVRGRFGVADVLGPFADPDIAAVARRINVVVDSQLTSLFPGQRLSAVEIELRHRRQLTCRREAPGEATDPEWEAIVLRKRAELIDDEDLAGGLVGLLCSFDRVNEAAV